MFVVRNVLFLAFAANGLGDLVATDQWCCDLVSSGSQGRFIRC